MTAFEVPRVRKRQNQSQNFPVSASGDWHPAGTTSSGDGNWEGLELETRAKAQLARNKHEERGWEMEATLASRAGEARSPELDQASRVSASHSGEQAGRVIYCTNHVSPAGLCT